MKTPTTTRLILAMLSTAALLGLGGCATSLTKEELSIRFGAGEQTLYVVVPGKPTKLTSIESYGNDCGKWVLPETVSPALNEWMARNVCKDLSKWQSTPGVYHTKVWGMKGLKSMPALAPASLPIEENDILEYSIDISNDGQALRPAIVTRIARKAKDATKESGCYWDGGKGATTAFIGGGAVCDGWNWRDQKFAKE